MFLYYSYNDLLRRGAAVRCTAVFRPSWAACKMSTGTAQTATTASRSQALRRDGGAVSDKDKYEFMLLDSRRRHCVLQRHDEPRRHPTATLSRRRTPRTAWGGHLPHPDGELVMAACSGALRAEERGRHAAGDQPLTLVDEQLKNATIAIIMGPRWRSCCLRSGCRACTSCGASCVPLGQVEAHRRRHRPG